MTEDDRRLISECTEVLMCLAKGEQPRLVGLCAEDACSETRCLCNSVSLFVAAYSDMQEFLRGLSSGNLGHNAPVRNQFFAAFKELQANLRHLVWQTSQIADGDLSQSVDFLGDFSVSFNKMIDSLREKRRLEQELKVVNEKLGSTVRQLQIANEELESFSYSVSHDLRSPLHQMSGFAAILREKVETSHRDDQLQNYASMIEESAAKMQEIIDELLALARLGRVAMKYGTIGMNKLVKDSINQIMSQAGQRDIEWKINELPDVYGDNALLGLVVTNLISNAVKFTRHCTEASIEIGHTDGGSEHIFFVRDTGAGFDMRYADKLFGVFKRLHLEGEYEGNGIGLANVRRIISRHGGRVWAEGAVGQGATFYFTLPKSAAP